MNNQLEFIKTLLPNDCIASVNGSVIILTSTMTRPYCVNLFMNNGEWKAFVKVFQNIRDAVIRHGVKWSFHTIEDIRNFWSMGSSLYAYNYPLSASGKEVLEREEKSYHDYLSKYRLPKELKADILDMLRNQIQNVEVAVGVDNEGGSYNSLSFKI